MSRRAMTVVVGAVAVAALLVGVRMAVNENGAGEGAAAGSFAARTAWGEPNLTGVWKGDPLAPAPDVTRSI